MSSAAEVQQDGEGFVSSSGLWAGIVPLTPEDLRIRASRAGVSSLEWLRRRLMSSPMIAVEVVG